MQPPVPGIDTLPDKLYFKVGEVSAITGVAPYVLRFWESEFSQVKPKRTEAGRRLYRKKDVITLLTIKHLLYDQKYTIAGARRQLRSWQTAWSPGTRSALMEDIRRELQDIRDLLDGDPE